MIIGVDFDGTCVTHEYPRVGREIGAVPVLRELVKEGHELILWTMRSGMPLIDAQAWFEENGIPLLSVNCNPTQHEWTSSPKAYAQLYIDDAALGAPLCDGETIGERPFINWGVVRTMLLSGSENNHV